MDSDEKQKLESQFKELEELAREQYPDIDDSISFLNNEVFEFDRVQEFLNNYYDAPSEVASNHISIA